MRSWILPFASFNIPDRAIGTVYTLFSGFFFGLLGYFGVTLMNAGVAIESMLFWRFALSALFLFSVRLFNKKTPRILPWRHLVLIFLQGAALYSSCTLLYFQACRYIGTGLAMVVFYTYPVMVMLIDRFYFKNKISLTSFIAVLTLMLGLIILVEDNSQGAMNLTGLCFSLLSAILYTIYLTVSKNNKADPLSASLMLSLGCLPAFFFSALMTGHFVIPTSLSIWANVFGIGIICTALPILFLLRGLSKISALQASIFSVLEPVFVMIFGILLLKEQLSSGQIMGAMTLLSGALISMWR